MLCQDFRFLLLSNVSYPYGHSNTGALLKRGYAKARSPRGTHSKQILGSYENPGIKAGTAKHRASVAEEARSLWLCQTIGLAIVIYKRNNTNLQLKDLPATSFFVNQNLVWTQPHTFSITYFPALKTLLLARGIQCPYLLDGEM